MPCKTYRAFRNGPHYRQRAEKEENAIDFSVFRQFHAPLTSNGFSIKYVVQGTERYRSPNSHYDVTAGMYLLTNAFWDCEVTIDSATDVQGLCLDIWYLLMVSTLGNGN